MCNWIESRWGLSNMRGVARFKYLVGKCVSDVDSGGNVPEEVGVRGAGRGSEVPWWGGVYIWARYVGLHPEDEARKRWVVTYSGRKGS